MLGSYRWGLGFLLFWIVSVPASAAPEGEKLYNRHCASCHGIHGQGGVGVPLALPDFLNSVDDDFLIKTIRHGRSGRVMPAFRQLSNAQILAVVAHIRSWAPGGAPALSAKPVKGNAGRGKTLFAKHCASCHGDKGQGGHGTGVTFSRPRDYPIMPPALNNPGFLTAASDQMIKTTLMRGRKGTPMVSFLKQGLSERDINDVVAFVRSFEKQPLPWEPESADGMTLEFDSPYSLAETVENIKQAAAGRNFRIIRVQNLDNGLVPEKAEDGKQVIVYFCNFSFINEALSLDPRVGLFMPCRVTAVERDGKVKIMSINPKHLSRLFNNAELDEACVRMYDSYMSIMEEATL